MKYEEVYFPTSDRRMKKKLLNFLVMLFFLNVLITLHHPTLHSYCFIQNECEFSQVLLQHI